MQGRHPVNLEGTELFSIVESREIFDLQRDNQNEWEWETYKGEPLLGEVNFEITQGLDTAAKWRSSSILFCAVL